jgi:hypothetical protein
MWAIAREEKRRGAPFDGVGHFRLERIDLQMEFGGDRRQTCLSIETRQGPGEIDRMLVSGGVGEMIVTHGTSSRKPGIQDGPRGDKG